jgi:type II secretory pathway pseudopilin PulG
VSVHRQIPRNQIGVVAAVPSRRPSKCARGDARLYIAAFTLIELLVVIAIIIVLASLILGTSTYVQMKGKRSRAEVEIAAMSAALESYKADNGAYPRDTVNAMTDNLDARISGDPATYRPASLFLYTQLSGTNPDRSSIPGAKSYFTFPPNMLIPHDQSSSVSAIVDPFGHSYGYSTAYQANPTTGYNPTFDLWSTGAVISNANPPDQSKWIKNW